LASVLEAFVVMWLELHAKADAEARLASVLEAFVAM